MSADAAEYDAPWKDALDLFLEPCLELLAPEAHRAIDWSRGTRSLDKEFERLFRRGETGRRAADKLVRVQLVGGEEAWVLIHLEVQAQRDASLPERMYVYDYRIFDRHRRAVASFAILADAAPEWRPGAYERRLLGSTTRREYRTIKLLDWEGRSDALRASRNPFALVVAAHLKALRTRKRPHERLRWKVALVRDLYRAGHSPELVRQLFRFIDWLLALPPELELEFDRELDRIEEETRMPFVTPRERAIQEAADRAAKEATARAEQAAKQAAAQAEQAAKQAAAQAEQAAEQAAVKAAARHVLTVVEARFGDVPAAVRAGVRRLSDAGALERLLRRAATASSVDEIAADLPDA